MFESLAERGSRVGILPNGSAKQPSQTGTGPHGQFWPKIKQPSPFLTYVAGLDPVRVSREAREGGGGEGGGGKKTATFFKFVTC